MDNLADIGEGERLQDGFIQWRDDEIPDCGDFDMLSPTEMELGDFVPFYEEDYEEDYGEDYEEDYDYEED